MLQSSLCSTARSAEACSFTRDLHNTWPVHWPHLFPGHFHPAQSIVPFLKLYVGSSAAHTDWSKFWDGTCFPLLLSWIQREHSSGGNSFKQLVTTTTWAHMPAVVMRNDLWGTEYGWEILEVANLGSNISKLYSAEKKRWLDENEPETKCWVNNVIEMLFFHWPSVLALFNEQCKMDPQSHLSFSAQF